MGTIFLVLYSSAWLITLIELFKKKRTFDCGIFVALLFFVYSVFSVILYNTSPEYSDLDISLFSLVYLYAMIMLTMAPVFRYNPQKVKKIVGPKDWVLNSIVIVYMLASILSIPSDLEEIRTSMVTLIVDSEAGLDQYHEMMADSQQSLGDGSISNIPSIFKNLLRNFVMIIVWYYVAAGKNKLFTVLCFLFIFVDMLLPLAKSQRGITIAILLIFLATFFAMKRYIPLKVKKKLTIVMISVIALMAIPFMAITHSRFDREEGGASSSLVTYIGQENLNFAVYAFDNNGLRYGDRVFPMFKRMLGFPRVPKNFWERRVKYPRLKINDEKFIGYVGDFVLDFGPIISFFLFIFFTSLLYPRLRIRGDTLYFHQLVLLSMLLYLGTIGGLKLFPFADNGALTLIMYILMYMYFYFGSRSIKLIIKDDRQ